MAFSFGQASSGGGFGAPSTTPAFGAAPASSGGFGFGGASTPAFGAAPASSGGFGFGGASTPAFGAASSGGFGFGGSSTPAFGAASSGGFGFGGASTPAFGAASSGGFGFGGATGGSLFGGGATTAFGAAAPSSSPFGGTSLFGGASAPAFGAPAAGGAAGSIFGAAAAAPAPTAPGAGAVTQFAPVSLSATGAAGGGGGAGAPDAARELQEIANCYTPGHPSFKFSHLFLSVVRPEQRQRPLGVDELSWKQALKEAGGEDNADGLWPVQANGFGDLLKRAQAQAAAIEENRQRLSELRDLAHKLARRQEGEVRGRVRALQARHVELSQRLLAAARCVDGLEGRLAMYMGVRGDLSREREASIARTLDAVEAELSLAAAGSLQRRADVVAAAARLRASGGGGQAAGGGGGGQQQQQGLDEASMEQLFEVLKDHADALARLQDVLRRDILDTEVLRGGGARDQTAPAGLGMAVMEAA